MIAITERIIGGSTDQNVRLQTAGLSRPMSIGTDWTKIRVGIRYAFNLGTYTGSLSGTPRFGFGICANAQYEIFSYTNVSHMFGILSNATTMTPGLSGSEYAITVGGGGILLADKVGSTITTGSGSLSAGTALSASPQDGRSCLWLQIQKGSPNFTCDMCYPGSAAPAVIDLSESEFFLGMETDPGSIPALSGNFSGYQSRTAIAHALDEAANGYFNGVWIDWNRTTWSVEVSDVAVYKVS